jgi:hypothetical protein
MYPPCWSSFGRPCPFISTKHFWENSAHRKRFFADPERHFGQIDEIRANAKNTLRSNYENRREVKMGILYFLKSLLGAYWIWRRRRFWFCRSWESPNTRWLTGYDSLGREPVLVQGRETTSDGDLPAIIDSDGTQELYKEGTSHLTG